MNTEKLIAFAQAVGIDIKELKRLLNEKITEQTLTTAIEQAKTAVKEEILGAGVPEQLDSLKEIADEISRISGDSQTAIVQKLSDLGQKIETLENLDLVATYNAAKA